LCVEIRGFWQQETGLQPPHCWSSVSRLAKVPSAVRSQSTLQCTDRRVRLIRACC
jgi:hypothetical protein